MKAASYYILAGIFVVAAVFFMVDSPVQTFQFSLISLPLVTTHTVAAWLLGSGAIIALYGLGLHANKASFQDPKSLSAEAASQAAISMAYISPKWRCVKANKLFCQLLGYSAQELAKMDFQRLIHADDLKNDLPGIQKMLLGQQHTHQSQQRYLDKNGDLLALAVTISLARDKAGKPLYFVCQFQQPHALPVLNYAKTVYSTIA